MVLGIGDGSIEITLDRQFFSPGENVTGKVRLHLKGPKKAKKLHVEFYGNIVNEIYSGSTMTKETVRVFPSAQQLSGEKTFQDGEEYAFSLPISPLALSAPPAQQNQPNQSPFGGIGGIFGSGRGRHMNQPPRTIAGPDWFVSAELDVFLFAINKHISVQVVQAPQQPQGVQQAPPQGPPWAQQPGSQGNQQQPPWVP